MPADFTELERRYGLPAGILSSVMRAESGGRLNAVSPVGAQGPFQFMPATAQQYGVQNPFDLDQSAQGAAQFLGDLSRKYSGDVPSMLAGYNWGQGNLDRQGMANAPKETRDYIARVTGGVGGRDLSAELFGEAQPAREAAGRDLSAELFGEAQPAKQAAPAQPESAPAGERAPLMAQVGRGMMDVFQGGKQLALNVGAGLGVVDPAKAEAYNQQLREELALYERNNPNFQLARMAGGAAALPLPGAAFTTIPRMVASGALAGALQPVTGQDFATDKALQMGAGAVLSPVVGKAAQAAAAGVGKLAGRATGRMSAQADELMKLGQQHGVPLRYSDITGGQFTRRLEDVMEYTPGFGLFGRRETQQRAAHTAAQEGAERLRNELINMKWSGLGEVQRAATSGGARAKEATALLDMVNSSGDDWNRIVKASGNLNLFRKKLISDRYYDEAARQASGTGRVDFAATREALKSELKNIDTDLLPDTELSGLLSRIQTRLSMADDEAIKAAEAAAAKGEEFLIPDTTFVGANRLRSRINDAISGFYVGENKMVGSAGVESLARIRNAIETDMSDFASSTGNPELVKSWQRANSFYANNVTKYKNIGLASALKDAHPDEIFGQFVKAGAGRADRAREFFNALDPRGQSAVRYGMVARSIDKAFDPTANQFDPGKFAGELERLSESRGVFFKGQGKHELDGFIKLMRHSEHSAAKAVPSLSSQQAIGLGTSAVAGFLHMPMTVAAGGMLGVTRLLLTTDAGKRYLLSANMLKPGSNAMADLVVRMNNELTKVAGAAAGAEQGQPGRVLP